RLLQRGSGAHVALTLIALEASEEREQLSQRRRRLGGVLERSPRLRYLLRARELAGAKRAEQRLERAPVCAEAHHQQARPRMLRDHEWPRRERQLDALA